MISLLILTATKTKHHVFIPVAPRSRGREPLVKLSGGLLTSYQLDLQLHELLITG